MAGVNAWCMSICRNAASVDNCGWGGQAEVMNAAGLKLRSGLGGAGDAAIAGGAVMMFGEGEE